MLATDLLERDLGSISPFAFTQRYSNRLLNALQPAPNVYFDAGRVPRQGANASTSGNAVAHQSGTNALAIEKFEGRYLVSGAANGSISMWDLEAISGSTQDGQGDTGYTPLGSVKPQQGHSYGLTGLSFYPFDSLAFLASSYDHTVKLYDSSSLSLSATFELGSVVYSHAISPIATHLLVACATQHPAVRLADLRSGTATQSLIGHGGAAILSVAWSPKHEHILVSGATDGSLHVWDIRRSASSLGVLDMEDSIGVTGHDGLGEGARLRNQGKAHIGPINGLAWTRDGRHLVSAGHDERIRVWDMASGANTLANFGPIVRNVELAAITPLLAPRALAPRGEDVLLFPNGREILLFELYEGKLLKRLKAAQLPSALGSSEAGGQRNSKNRIISLSWRAHHVEMLSAHADGTIRSWRPRTSVDVHMDEIEQMEQSEESETRKRKRQTLDDIYRDITATKISYS